MALIIKKIKDSVSVSGGGGGFNRPKRRPGGGGGGISASILTQQQREESNRKAAVEKAAHDQKLFREAQIKQQKLAAREYQKIQREEERIRRKGKESPKVSTGVFQKGGAVVQETTGDFASLQRLNKQRPGSVLVQNKKGDYILVEARGGINLARKGTFDKFNENLALEGRGLFFSIGEPNEAGGIDYTRRIKDSVGVSDGIGGFTETPGGKDYSITFGDSEKASYRPAQPREISEMISERRIAPTFIGAPTVLAMTQQQVSASQQNVRQDVLPQTFVDKSGKDIVTITGQSKGSKFGIFQVSKSPQPKLKGLKTTVTRKEESPSVSIERVLKRTVEPLYAAGVETFAPLVTKTLRLMGQEKEAERITKELNISYEKYAGVPKGNTPLMNLIATGQPLTGRGLLSDITGYGTEALLLGGGALPAIGKLGKVKLLPKILKGATKEKTPEPAPFRQTINKDIFKDDTALYGFGKQRIPLAPKAPGKIVPSGKPKLVKIDPNYVPSRMPVFTSTKIKLGRAAISPTSPKPVVKKLTLDGDNLVRPGGKDFVRSSVSLGSGAVKTPPRQLQSSLNRPVKIDTDYRVSTSPINLSPLTKVKLSLGRGTVRYPKSILQKPNRDFVKRTFQQKKPEVRTRSGLILIMKEPVQQKQFTSTKVSLGKSDQTLQIKDGKTIQKSINKVKSKPSSTFFLPAASSSTTQIYSSESETMTVTKITQKTTPSLMTMIETRLPEKLKTPIQTTTPRLATRQTERRKLRLVAPLRPLQPTKQKQTPIQKQPPALKQIIEEVPPEKPITRLKIIYAPRDDRRDRRRPKVKRIQKVDFLGGTHQETVEGFRTKKVDISFGKKTAKLARKNILLTRGKIGKGVSIF